MVTQNDRLAALERIARIKAERELKKFAAFSQRMAHARQRADALRAALDQCYRSTAPLGVAEARMANAQAGRSARELTRADRELADLEPRFEAARQVAAREFGRAEGLLSLSRSLAAKSRGPRF